MEPTTYRFDFTIKEMEVLAEMLCGRVDALKDIAKNAPKLPNLQELKDDILSLKSLDTKLRPYYKEGN